MIALLILAAALQPVPTRAAFLSQLDRPRVPLAPEVSATSGTVEHLTIATEKKPDGSFERVPILIVRPATTGRHAVVVVLHGTGGRKESTHSWLDRLAARNIIGVAIDARYHGDRAGGAQGSESYQAAITAAWRAKAGQRQEHPFYYDTVWDLLRTVDYLQSRPDVDPARIGMLGISMGGIETWLAAAADPRIAVAVPAISVQSFAWSLEHDSWQGRAATIKAPHEVAAHDLGEPAVNARVCRALWNKVIPGILDRFDCPNMLPLIAPRPLLILSGELDPNNPLGGAKVAFAAARQAYKSAPDRLEIDVAPGVAHKVTDGQQDKAIAWLVKWLAH
jgi:dienelactone hydrolase